MGAGRTEALEAVAVTPAVLEAVAVTPVVLEATVARAVVVAVAVPPEVLEAVHTRALTGLQAFRLCLHIRHSSMCTFGGRYPFGSCSFCDNQIRF